MIHDTGYVLCNLLVMNKFANIYSVNCRLPHTPRTPSIAMSHYFDDIFHRSVETGVPHSGMPRIRRSSTARSIGARSDFDDDTRSVTNSIYHDDPDRARERTEADAHMHSYVSEQLERYKDDKKDGNYEHDDEFETKA
jgi:hypothetical protein